MMPGRFFLGVGTGENLNEHITGERWPAVSVRREMLEEAVEIIRELWSGEFTQYQGEYFTVDDARIYTLPDPLPHIYVAAAGHRVRGSRRAHRRRLHLDGAEARARAGVRRRRRAEPAALRADHRLLCEGRSAGAEDGARSLAERRTAGRTERRATAAAALHAGGEDRDRRRSREDHRLRARPGATSAR